MTISCSVLGPSFFYNNRSFAQKTLNVPGVNNQLCLVK